MARQQILKLYRLQGKLAGLRSYLVSQETLNERLKEATDSMVAAQAYDFNLDWSTRSAFIAGDILRELEQITKEIESEQEQDNLPF